MSDEWRFEDADSQGSGHSEEEMNELAAQIGNLARELTRQDLDLMDPPPDLWTSIHAATSASPPLKPELATVSDLANTGASPHVRDGRWFRPARFAAAAAIAALLATGGAIYASQRNDSGQLVAQAQITNEGLPVAFVDSGSAAVRRDGTDLYLTLDLPDLPATDEADAFYEVWMIDTDVVGMVSLGVVPPSGRVDLPDDLDPAAFPVVDISIEPLDGDPTHSGQSILRGILQ